MNVHFSLKTEGSYLLKVPGESSYRFIKLFMKDPENDQADNYLLMGTVEGDIKQVLGTLKQGVNGSAERISFHIDDNDSTEIYWYAENDWHCMITPNNEGKSIILTRTHPKHKRESMEFVFHSFS
jgi:hypothetical protein